MLMLLLTKLVFNFTELWIRIKLHLFIRPNNSYNAAKLCSPNTRTIEDKMVVAEERFVFPQPQYMGSVHAIITIESM